MKLIKAPWSQTQIENLTRWQKRGDVHEYTCPHDHGDKSRVLIATPNGWVCENCDYTQDWALDIEF